MQVRDQTVVGILARLRGRLVARLDVHELGDVDAAALDDSGEVGGMRQW